jgi:hypothetical protein
MATWQFHGLPHFTRMTSGLAKSRLNAPGTTVCPTALVYYALAVSVQKLNWVFNGNEMTVSERVDVIDHGCQSCSLS